MAPREKGGALDARLNVYGTKGLKCAGQYSFPSFHTIHLHSISFPSSFLSMVHDEFTREN